MKELRQNTIKWLAQIAGELQKRIRELEQENAGLRSENVRLRKQERHREAMGKAVGR